MGGKNAPVVALVQQTLHLVAPVVEEHLKVARCLAVRRRLVERRGLELDGRHKLGVRLLELHPCRIAKRIHPQPRRPKLAARPTQAKIAREVVIVIDAVIRNVVLLPLQFFQKVDAGVGVGTALGY